MFVLRLDFRIENLKLVLQNDIQSRTDSYSAWTQVVDYSRNPHHHREILFIGLNSRSK